MSSDHGEGLLAIIHNHFQTSGSTRWSCQGSFPEAVEEQATPGRMAAAATATAAAAVAAEAAMMACGIRCETPLVYPSLSVLLPPIHFSPESRRSPISHSQRKSGKPHLFCKVNSNKAYEEWLGIVYGELQSIMARTSPISSTLCAHGQCFE
ncbi:hypothetical protein Taro_014268 [Colocasia esculenta]|uniref:Uncharacterized protein n=1 Tax=Colocasia esculenta TaxID=4460 RepID=A0A843UIC1_COLES|nr:hypothetical protein [Colocasia esculenta]